MTLNLGNWKFEKSNKFIYRIDSETMTNHHFKLEENQSHLYDVQNFRKASVIHKLIRTNLKNKLHIGTKFHDLVIESQKLLDKYSKDKNTGFAFPLGISVNEIMAHDTSMIDDERKLNKNDIVKIDLGIHVNGSIIDSAFTTIIDGDSEFIDFYNPLLQATQDATYSGICLSGVDARLYEISEGIKEVIESYELENGTPIKAVNGLGGHNILPYKVHGGKLILSCPHECQLNMKMEENEVYAVETFASTGYGEISQLELKQCNHWMLNDNLSIKNKTLKNNLLKWCIEDNNKLPFTQIWCKNIPKLEKSFKDAVELNQIIPFPPLTDKEHSYSSQFEHTIFIRNTGVEIFSLGDDY
jgi:methionyl aminopeptidase